MRVPREEIMKIQILSIVCTAAGLSLACGNDMCVTDDPSNQTVSVVAVPQVIACGNDMCRDEQPVVKEQAPAVAIPVGPIACGNDMCRDEDPAQVPA